MKSSLNAVANAAVCQFLGYSRSVNENVTHGADLLREMPLLPAKATCLGDISVNSINLHLNF